MDTNEKRMKFKNVKNNILVVDDDILNLLLVEEILNDKKLNIISLNSGKKALEYIENEGEKLDIVILDVLMPEISGIEVLEIVRKKYSMYVLPILLLTANGNYNDISNGFNKGANDYIVKPFNRIEFIARVNSLLRISMSAKQEKMLRLAEIKTLQSQIQPHFLFNSINTIISLMRIDIENSRKLLIDLSEYLRKSLNFQVYEEFVDFEYEIKCIKSYLSLEKARFMDKLEIEYNIEKNIKHKVPPLILQPIVENAVKHGVFKKINGGKVSISAEIIDTKLCLTVEDNGVGIQKELVEDLLLGKSKFGIGLKNVNNRLNSIYGEELEIESDLGQGTIVRMKIPNKEFSYAKNSNS